MLAKHSGSFPRLERQAASVPLLAREQCRMSTHDGTASAKQWHMVSELAGMKQQIGPAHRLAAWTRRLNGDFQSLIPNP